MFARVIARKTVNTTEILDLNWVGKRDGHSYNSVTSSKTMSACDGLAQGYVLSPGMREAEDLLT